MEICEICSDVSEKSDVGAQSYSDGLCTEDDSGRPQELKQEYWGQRVFFHNDQIATEQNLVTPNLMRMWTKNCQTLQFSSAAQSCPAFFDPMDCSTPGLPVHHQLPEFTQIHVHWVGDAIQPSHPLSSPSPPALNLSQHQGLFQWVSSLHQVAKVLEFQLQPQSFQWTLRTDLL